MLSKKSRWAIFGWCAFAACSIARAGYMVPNSDATIRQASQEWTRGDGSVLFWESEFEGTIVPSARLAKRLAEASTPRAAIEALVDSYNKEMDNVGSGRWLAGFVPPSLKVCPQMQGATPSIVVRRAGQASCSRPAELASRAAVSTQGRLSGAQETPVKTAAKVRQSGAQAYGVSLGQNMAEALRAMSNAMPSWREGLARSEASAERKCLGGRALALDFFTSGSPVSYVRVYCADQKLFAVSVNESTKDSFEAVRSAIESARGASSDQLGACQAKLSVAGGRAAAWKLDELGTQYAVQWIPRGDSGAEAGLFTTLCRNE